MGMFDDITIEKDNQLGLVPSTGYQTYDIHNACDRYYILPDGKIILKDKPVESDRCWKTENIPEEFPCWPSNLNGHISIYDGGSNSYDLEIQNGYVVKVLEPFTYESVPLNLDECNWLKVDYAKFVDPISDMTGVKLGYMQYYDIGKNNE